MAEPDGREIHDRWLTAMRQGDFLGAWKVTDLVEARRRARGFRVAEGGDLVWDGSSFRGQKVLVRCLHGLGDTLQFIRFVPRIAAVADSITVAMQPALLPLFPPQSEFGDVRNGWSDEPFPCDVEIEVMELAYALRVSAATLAADRPCLDLSWIIGRATFRPPPRQGQRLRVGLIWSASSWDSSRSIPPELLGPLASPEIEWVSLQQNADPAELPFPITNFAPQTSQALDVARAMLEMDLLVTVDAMPAHLAGALQRPVWVLLKHDADWRWMTIRSDSPWYPSMRLFRQPQPGDWGSVLQDVSAALCEKARDLRGATAT